MRVLLVIYDDNGHIGIFPMGLAYIAAVLEKEGYQVEVYNQDMHHYPDEHLTEYLNTNKFDVVGVSVIAGYYQYKKLLSISEAINKSKNRPFYILGGYGPSPEPKYFIEKTKADVVVIGEGEETAVELFDAIANRNPLHNIKGIAFKDGEEIIVNDRRPLIEDINSIAWPAYHKFPIEYYRLMPLPKKGATDFALPMMSGRGCTFKCTFCYRMDTGFRARNADDLLEEVKYLNKEYGINRFTFQDDLLMVSVVRTEDICAAFERANLNVQWDCNGRLNYARSDLLQRMRKCGCVYINYGIESMDGEVLKNMRKGLRPEQIVKGIEATLEVGISPGLNFIFGNIGDNRKTIQKTVDFLLKYDDFSERRTLKPVTPYPGSPLYYDAINKGLLGGVEDFYENKHLNSDLLAVNFTDLTDEDFYKCMLDANTQLLENYYKHERKSVLAQLKALYETRDTSFRGFRHDYG